jgi:hypothetical protein
MMIIIKAMEHNWEYIIYIVIYPWTWYLPINYDYYNDDSNHKKKNQITFILFYSNYI